MHSTVARMPRIAGRGLAGARGDVASIGRLHAEVWRVRAVSKVARHRRDSRRKGGAVRPIVVEWGRCRAHECAGK